MAGEQNSVTAVFEAVADKGEMSRAQLSQLTGFSLMTVGKAVDILEGCGFFVQRKTSGGSVGRKMSVSEINGSCGMLLFDLTGEKATVRVCDFSLTVRGEYTSEASDVSELMAEGFGYFLESYCQTRNKLG